jgi:ribosome biogenesis GTPase A
LRKGGEPDVDATAKIVLVDWQRGDIPYYHLPDGEVDKFDHKLEGTIDNVKEEEFLEMVGAPNYENAGEPLEQVDDALEIEDDE